MAVVVVSLDVLFPQEQCWVIQAAHIRSIIVVPLKNRKSDKKTANGGFFILFRIDKQKFIIPGF
jgi:hypothetical protein